MPICPGCEQTVSYDRLDIHERYCDGIWSDEVGQRSIERLERRILALERRLDAQVRELESDVERRLLRLEKSQKGQRTTRRE